MGLPLIPSVEFPRLKVSILKESVLQNVSSLPLQGNSFVAIRKHLLIDLLVSFITNIVLLSKVT